MIHTIKTPAGDRTMLLGYEAIRYLSKPLDEGMDYLDQIEQTALIGLNVHARRNNQPQITKEEMISWFEEDEEVYLQCIEAVKSFAQNFSRRVSEEPQTSTPTPEPMKK